MQVFMFTTQDARAPQEVVTTVAHINTTSDFMLLAVKVRDYPVVTKALLSPIKRCFLVLPQYRMLDKCRITKELI